MSTVAKITIAILILGQRSSLAQDQNVTYTITDLGTLGGTSSVGCGLNSRGEVVGFSSIPTGQSHAFRWSNGEMTDLGTLPTDFFSEGRDINSRGQVVGDSTVKFFTPPFHAVLFEKGHAIPLGTLGGPASFAVAINQRGQVVGASRTASFQLHAFLWEDDVMTDLGALPGDTASVARAINKRGQVVGNSAPLPLGFFGDCPTTPRQVEPWHAALWDSGVITDLGTFGGIFSIAKGINDHGTIVGSSTLASGEEHAFLLRDGTMNDLGKLGGTYSLSNQINNHGQVVGLSRIASGELHAFLWEDGVMTDLNNLIPAGSGWILVEATAINEAGQIAGVGSINGQTHAFLLTPNEN
jgi:probable HAF family extracellular repeat protein